MQTESGMTPTRTAERGGCTLYRVGRSPELNRARTRRSVQAIDPSYSGLKRALIPGYGEWTDRKANANATADGSAAAAAANADKS
jgi:hypothetical protein